MNNYLAWYIAGPLIGLMVPILLIIRSKQLGISSGLRWLGSLLTPGLSYFDYNRKKDFWQIEFTIGILLVSVLFGSLGLIPEFKGDKEILIAENAPVFLVGGILIGFGSRMANGCTAGHCIMGTSQFSTASIIATIFFFIGGWIASNFLTSIIF